MRQSNTTESVRSYLILLSTAHVDCSRSRRIDYLSRAREQCQAIGKVQRKPRPASVLLASPKCPTDVGEGRTGLMCRVRGPCKGCHLTDEVEHLKREGVRTLAGWRSAR
jgi:hypothetical protein